MEKLVEAVKIAALDVVSDSKPIEVNFGTVTNDNPLEITIEDTPYSKKFLILSRNVTDYKTKISFDNPGIKMGAQNYEHSTEESKGDPYKISFVTDTKHEITVYNSLKTGEKVILLRIQGGQKYLIWDRVGD